MLCLPETENNNNIISPLSHFKMMYKLVYLMSFWRFACAELTSSRCSLVETTTHDRLGAIAKVSSKVITAAWFIHRQADICEYLFNRKKHKRVCNRLKFDFEKIIFNHEKTDIEWKWIKIFSTKRVTNKIVKFIFEDKTQKANENLSLP